MDAKCFLSLGVRQDTSDPQATLCLAQDGHQIISNKKRCLDFNLIWLLVDANMVIIMN